MFYVQFETAQIWPDFGYVFNSSVAVNLYCKKIALFFTETLKNGN